MSDHVSPREVTLGTYRDDLGRPSFEASFEGRPLLVELDSSAVLHVASRIDQDKVAHMLNQKRAIIRAAAERLIQQGFHIMRDDKMVVVLSALDL